MESSSICPSVPVLFLSIISLRFTQFIVYVRISCLYFLDNSLFKATYFIRRMHHILLSYSFMAGQVGYFPVLSIVNHAVMSTSMRASICRNLHSFLWGIDALGWHVLTRVCLLPCRRLQEEDQQFRTSSLPAIPNPFPELCGGPGSPPAAAPSSLPPPPSQPPTKQVSGP